MSMHASLSPEARRNIEARDLTSGGEVSFVRILEIAAESAARTIEQGNDYGYPLLVEKGEVKLAEIAEQSLLLDAIMYGYIQPIHKGER
jgi:hypothetical protein